MAYEIDQSNVNVHATEVPWPLNIGQPASFTCNDTTAANAVDCELLITAHPTGSAKTTVGTYAVSFS